MRLCALVWLEVVGKYAYTLLCNIFRDTRCDVGELYNLKNIVQTDNIAAVSNKNAGPVSGFQILIIN